jgi:hypothetical protein
MNFVMPLRVCQDALGGHSLVYNSSHINKLKLSHVIKKLMGTRGLVISKASTAVLM